MEKVKVSIIVPIYNVQKYIKRCMDSLIAQNFENYEIVAVNDGSLDDSMKYVYELQDKYKNITICERENGGLSAARNTGILNAKGEYILFCDSDDELKKDCLEIIYNEAKSKDLDILLYDAQTIWDFEKKEDSQSSYIRENISEAVLKGSQMLKELVEKKQYFASACMYLIKRELILKKQLFFKEGILHEDELFTPIIIMEAQSVAHRNWLIYGRHMREGSIMTSNNMVRRMNDLEIVIQELVEYVNKEESSEKRETLWKIILEHIKFFLGQTLIISELDCEMIQKRKNVYSIVKDNHLKLNAEFKVYLLYLRLKRIFYKLSRR